MRKINISIVQKPVLLLFVGYLFLVVVLKDRKERKEDWFLILLLPESPGLQGASLGHCGNQNNSVV